uniref:Calpain catalytic domain-containing protein n=1 Tax=Mesocestoides corti TaxID=53468 RepID=A0A5K3EIF0_MESCO
MRTVGGGSSGLCDGRSHTHLLTHLRSHAPLLIFHGAYFLHHSPPFSALFIKSLRPQQHRGAVVPEPINESQVAALKNAFEKVSGPDGEVTADELIDILNVAFTKELNEGREGNQPEVPNNKPPAAAPSRVSSKGLSFLCCGLGEKAENANSEAGPTTAKPGAEGGDNDFAFEGFNIETCRSLISMMDVDRSGSLDFEEFKSLWETLRLWKGIFKKFDADNSGTMSSFELRNALNFAGFHVDNATFSSLVLRFSNRDRILRFDDYIICCARLRTAFETVRSRPSFGGAELLNVLLYL